MTKWHGGKGSTPRPIDPKVWEKNYEAIFGQKQKRPGKKDEAGSK